MAQVLGIVSDRKEVPDAALLALTALYEGLIAPAVDRVENSLLGHYS